MIAFFNRIEGCTLLHPAKLRFVLVSTFDQHTNIDFTGRFLTHGKVLNFCKDKMRALQAFCAYYLVGIISMIFQLNAQIYVNISQGILLLVSTMFVGNLIKTYFNK